jgi:hypothetical protein
MVKGQWQMHPVPKPLYESSPPTKRLVICLTRFTSSTAKAVQSTTAWQPHQWMIQITLDKVVSSFQIKPWIKPGNPIFYQINWIDNVNLR